MQVWQEYEVKRHLALERQRGVTLETAMPGTAEGLRQVGSGPHGVFCPTFLESTGSALVAVMCPRVDCYGCLCDTMVAARMCAAPAACCSTVLNLRHVEAQVQHIELAQTLVSLPQPEERDEADAEAEPMPQRPLVLAGFPLDPGMRLYSSAGSCYQRRLKSRLNGGVSCAH